MTGALLWVRRALEHSQKSFALVWSAGFGPFRRSMNGLKPALQTGSRNYFGDDWPAELRAAVESYPRLSTSAPFEANFWRQLQARRARAQTLRGRLEAFAQIQLGGLLVWRLAGSTLAGAALPALVLAWSLAAPPAKTRPWTPIKAPPLSALAWRELEREHAWKTPFRAQSQLVALWLDGATSLRGGAPCSIAV